MADRPAILRPQQHKHRRWLDALCVCGALLCASSAGALAQAPTVPPDAQGAANPAQGAIPSRSQPASVPDGFSVAAVGDLIIGEPEVATPETGFGAVEKLIQSADIGFGNLEESLIDPLRQHIWPAAEFGGATLSGPPSLAADLKKMGFDMVARANNHATDWGVRGMEATDRALDKAGIAHAGTGLDLAAARAPAELATPWGRIALVAMTSTFRPMEPAGAPRRGAPGRPGVNVLRTTLYHVVTARQMECLRNIYDTQPHKPAHPADPNADQLHLFGNRYRVGPAPGLLYTMDPHDLDAILRSIREGKQTSNFEIAYIHAHNPGNWSSEPASYMQKLAHAAIEAGADEFVASGPHRLRGIEIYQGKPIFYSLGNFFFENMQQRFMSPDQMAGIAIDANMSTTSDYYHHVLSGLGLDAPIYYHSVVAVSTFDSNGDVREIKLYPIDLGYKRVPLAENGVPYLAKPQVAQSILQRLQRLSKPYGTRIEIHGSVGVIRVGAPG